MTLHSPYVGDDFVRWLGRVCYQWTSPPEENRLLPSINSTIAGKACIVRCVNGIDEGRQVYIVYPLIKESEKIDLKNLEEGYQHILEEFPEVYGL